MNDRQRSSSVDASRPIGVILLAWPLVACGGAPPYAEREVGAPIVDHMDAKPTGRAVGALATALETPTGKCRASTERGRLVVECLAGRGERTWGFEERASPNERLVIGRDDERLFVVRHDTQRTGGEIAAYGLRSGTPLWQRRLEGLGASAAPPSENAIELRTPKGFVRVLGWESAGKYIELRDAATGALVDLRRANAEPCRDTCVLAAARVDPEEEPSSTLPMTDEAFAFDGEAPRFLRTVNARAKLEGAESVDCALTLDQEKEATHLGCFVGGQQRWVVDRAEQFSPGGAIVASGTSLYVVDYNARATGATISGYDLATGRRRFTHPLHGLGPIGHSKYFNDVDVRVERGEVVVVSGWEAQGKYVEVVDGETGASASNRQVP